MIKYRKLEGSEIHYFLQTPESKGKRFYVKDGIAFEVAKSKEKIIETAIEEKADVIALSALMTTTMQEMRHVIQHAKENGVSAKIIIGGAVITEEYAEEIGADGYSKDAADAVKLVKKLLGA